MGAYRHLLAGLPVMLLIVVVAMVVIIIAMAMDALFGWRKAKLRGEARTSYLFSRSITKFTLYEGVLMIACGIDTLIHFVWAMFNQSLVYCVPIVSCIAGVVLCVVEIWSMKEKADEKTRHNFAQAVKIVADAISREEAVDIAKHIIDKTTSENHETE
jgi:Flp pilus assembly protein TadB